MQDTVEFVYTNHKGSTRIRKIWAKTVDIEFLLNPGFGYQPGWFMSGVDAEKEKRRSFALSHIKIPDHTGLRYRILEGQR